MTAPLTWVVGAGGLLGSAVTRVLARRGPVWAPRSPIPWATPERGEAIETAVADFARAADGGAWQVAWCAGAGVPSSPEDVLAAEEQVIGRALDALARMPGPGTLFVASSAGGVFAGSANPPFSEATEPRPIAPYGHSKLRVEAEATRWAARTGHAVTIGRLSNLYGVDQDLGKAQGLVSAVVRATLLHRPVHIYVSMDTLRDYLWADDAGHLVADALQRDRDARARSVVRVMASEQATSVGALLRELQRVTGRRLQVVHAASPAAKVQARDLRLRSRPADPLPHHPRTPLPVGMLKVYLHLLQRQQRAELR